MVKIMEKNHIVYFCVLFIELTNYSLLMLYKEKGCIITKQSIVKKITKAFMKINLWITIKDFNLPYLTHESCKKKSWIWKKKNLTMALVSEFSSSTFGTGIALWGTGSSNKQKHKIKNVHCSSEVWINIICFLRFFLSFHFGLVKL